MTAAPGTVAPPAGPTRAHRLARVFGWLLAIALGVVVLDLLGVDVRGWLSELWDALTAIDPAYIVAGVTLQTIQTTLTALGWLYILRAGYPDADIPFRSILAAYAAGVSMNNFLPANLGTLASLLMFTALVAGATFPGVLGGMVVQKIFFTAAGTFVYLYLFLTVPGAAHIEFGALADHWVITLAAIGGGVFLVVLLVRRFRKRLSSMWEKAKEGGAILARPREYLLRVATPSFVAWLAKLAMVGVFLAAYGIPVTFHTIMSVVGGDSIANTVSATPGGVGVNQAINVASLRDVTDTATATAYSVGQQLILTMWNVVYAVVLVVWAFGFSGGKELVATSYVDAKTKLAEQKAEHDQKKAARKGERVAG